MKIIIKEEHLTSDVAFADCTMGAVYEAEMCENPMIELFYQMGFELDEEDIQFLEEGPQCLRFRDDKGEVVYCTFNEAVVVKPEHY
nr:MAG TPA: hypothetical protein [Caudoviricetes sp.]